MTTKELPPNLTARQLQVWRLVTRGHTTREIAERFAISQSAAKQTVDQLRRKFGNCKKRELIAEGLRFGILDGNPREAKS